MEMKFPNYGIHVFKATAILCQVFVHANAWMILALGTQLKEDVPLLEQKGLLVVGGLSMLVPMTAAAVLRMSLPLSKDGKRLIIQDWGVFIGLAGFLMLIESTKDALSIGASGFFSWNALHLIALTFLLTLALARFSIRAVWVVALFILTITPFVYDALAPFDTSLNIGPDFEPGRQLAFAFVGVTVLVFAFFAWALWKSSLFEAKYRVRLMILLSVIFALVAYWLSSVETTVKSILVFHTLPMGILMGSSKGPHIWGVFPWAGVTMTGFLIYDLILRAKNPKKTLAWLFFAGAILLVVFYTFFVDVMVEACVPKNTFSGFGSQCFNRTWQQTMLTISLFMFTAPLACVAEMIGFENRLMRAMSRSILWIYLFETSVLPFTCLWFFSHFGIKVFLWVYLAFALASAVLIALLLDLLPSKISLTMRRSKAW